MDRRVLLRNAFGMCMAGAAAAACQQVPLRQEIGGEFPSRDTSAARADQIRRAGAAQGWIIATRAPGLLRGTLNRREQVAVVDIPYDARRFSIRYVRNSNLNYDDVNISSNHTSHVQRLHRAILTQPAT